MQVVITGASGFIGNALMERYRSAGAQVCGIDRVADPGRGVLAGDVLEPAGWEHVLGSCDVVFHAAALVSVVAPADAMWRVNVLGTRRIVDAAARAGVGRFVHVSSIATYGLAASGELDETHPVRPDGNHYVDTKIAAEQVVLQAHAAGEVDVTVIRPTDVYGPGSRPWTITPVETMREGRFLLPAHGRGLMNPVYVDDLIDGFVAAAATPAASGQVVIVGDGTAVTTEEFFGHYAGMLGQGPVRCVSTPVAVGLAAAAGKVQSMLGRETELGGEAMRMLARPASFSIDRARRLLGFEPNVDLDEGMRRCERWLADQGLLT